MKMRTAELEGTALDWAAAHARGMRPAPVFGRGTVCAYGWWQELGPDQWLSYVHRKDYAHWINECESFPWGFDQRVWEPSADWSQSGLLMKELLRTGHDVLLALRGEVNQATVIKGPEVWTATAAWPEQAMTRVYVSCKIGKFVDVPKERLT